MNQRYFWILLSVWMGAFAQTTLDETLFLNRITAFWEEGEYKLAKTQIEEFLKVYPMSSFNDALYAALGDLWLQEKNYSSALDAYARIQNKDVAGGCFLSKAECLYELQLYAPLGRACEEQLAGGQDTPDVRYYAAIALYQQCAEGGEVETAKRAISHFEALLSTEFAPRTQEALAHLYAMAGELSKAVSLYEKLAAELPGKASESMYRIALLQTEYDKTLALETLQKVQGERRCEAMYHRLVLLFELERYDEILTEQEEILSIVAPEHRASVHLLLGRSHIAQGNYEEASKELQSYLASTPIDAAYHAALVSLLNTSFRLSDLVTFHQTLQQFEKNFPSDTELAKAKFCFALLLKQEDEVDKAQGVLKELLRGVLTASLKAEVLLEVIQTESALQHWQEERSFSLSFLKEFEGHALAPVVADHLLFASQKGGDRKDFLGDIDALMKLGLGDQGHLSLLKAETLCEIGLHEEAFTLLSAFVATKPSLEHLANAHALIGVCHKAKKEIAEFCAVTEQAIDEGAQVFPTHFLHASLYNAYLELERLDKADDHLLLAFETGAMLESENLLYLADRLFQRCTSSGNEELLGKTVSFFEANREIVNPLQLSELYLQSERFADAIALLETSKACVQKDFLLGTSFAKLGCTYEAIASFASVLQSKESPFFGKAVLETARLWMGKWQETGYPSNEDSQYVQVLCSLKDLSLQKNIQTEPLHLEASLTAIDLQMQGAEDNHEQWVKLLRLAQQNFTATDGILAKDYHFVKETLPEKNRIYQLYMKFIEAEILFHESELNQQKQLQAKAKNILLQMKEEVGSLDLAKRVQNALSRYAVYTASDSRIGLWQEGALNLNQAQPLPKQPNLNKLGDAGRYKFSGCPTQPESILEPRAV